MTDPTILRRKAPQPRASAKRSDQPPPGRYADQGVWCVSSVTDSNSGETRIVSLPIVAYRTECGKTSLFISLE